MKMVGCSLGCRTRQTGWSRVCHVRALPVFLDKSDCQQQQQVVVLDVPECSFVILRKRAFAHGAELSQPWTSRPTASLFGPKTAWPRRQVGPLFPGMCRCSYIRYPVAMPWPDCRNPNPFRSPSACLPVNGPRRCGGRSIPRQRKPAITSMLCNMISLLDSTAAHRLPTRYLGGQVHARLGSSTRQARHPIRHISQLFSP